MTLKQLTSKYISNTKQVFAEMKVNMEESLLVNKEKLLAVIDLAKRYLEDAEYHQSRNRFEVALTSVVYCEGLLDALKMLGAVRFTWPNEKQRKARLC